MADTFRSLLPEIYARLLPAPFDVPAPAETKATCTNCAMCPPAGSPPVTGARYFRPDAKCCTYHPILPNYLVGAILVDPRPEMSEGRDRILARLEDRRGVSPSSIAPPRKVAALQRATGQRAFGQSLVLLCPYFERSLGLCTIWPYREAVCSTYFCKYVDAADGQAFWRAMRDLLGYVEMKLAFGAARTLIPGYGGKGVDDLTVEDLEDRAPRDDEYASLWGDWMGREAEFFVQAHDWVRELAPEVLAQNLVNPTYEKLVTTAAAKRGALDSTALPERLIPNPALTWEHAEGGFRVSTYNPYDAVHGTPALHRAMCAFNADETVADVRARLARDEQFDLPEEVVLALYRYRVLIPPPDAPAT